MSSLQELDDVVFRPSNRFRAKCAVKELTDLIEHCYELENKIDSCSKSVKACESEDLREYLVLAGYYKGLMEIRKEELRLTKRMICDLSREVQTICSNPWEPMKHFDAAEEGLQ